MTNNDEDTDTVTALALLTETLGLPWLAAGQVVARGDVPANLKT